MNINVYNFEKWLFSILVSPWKSLAHFYRRKTSKWITELFSLEKRPYLQYFIFILSVYMFNFLLICLTFCWYVYISADMFIYLFICLSICLYIYVTPYMFTYLLIYLYICLYVNLPSYIFTYLLIFLYMCLYVYIFAYMFI